MTKWLCGARMLGPALLAACLCAGPARQAAGQQTTEERTYAAAQAALSKGDFGMALKNFEELSRSHPDVAELHATLGAIFFQQGDFERALKESSEAKRLKPELPRLDGLIAMSQSELGRYSEALPMLEETFRTADDEAIKRLSGLQLERAYTALHQESKAVGTALELQARFPNDAEVLYHNERIFGSFAYLTVQKLVEVAPDSPWRYQAQAEALESQGQHDSAIAEYRKVLAVDPRRRGVHYRIGRSLREKGRDSHEQGTLAEARGEFEQELKLDPRNANALYEVGELYRLSGDLASAQKYFAAALAVFPDFPEANLGLGTVLASLHQPAEALPHLKAAIAADPADEATWYRLAQVERSLGHQQEQQQAMQQFLNLHKAAGQGGQAAHEVTRQQVTDAAQP